MNSTVSQVGWWLVVVGAINWGLFALFNFDLVETIFGFNDLLLKVVYILVGLAGAWMLYEKFAKK